jgi:hypothetical protein
MELLDRVAKSAARGTYVAGDGGKLGGNRALHLPCGEDGASGVREGRRRPLLPSLFVIRGFWECAAQLQQGARLRALRSKSADDRLCLTPCTL